MNVPALYIAGGIPGKGTTRSQFADLRVSALVTEAGIDSPARRAALTRGIRVVELCTADDAEAGLFALAGGEGGVRSLAVIERPVASFRYRATKGSVSAVEQ